MSESSLITFCMRRVQNRSRNGQHLDSSTVHLKGTAISLQVSTSSLSLGNSINSVLTL